jgi:bifunctional non-homologous end joining protein LigD
VSADADNLGEYRRMRRFTSTPEPVGAEVAAPGGERGSRVFVIHKHGARRLHYDLRLELNGVLKSWAVPKGPSLDPSEKRLAVHVEDHPIDYGPFEGVIPRGEYGAGAVIVWDAGTWEPLGDAEAGLAKGELKFRLHGRKLRGSWVLVRLRGEADQWLLIKEKDQQVRPGGDDILTARPESVLSGRTLDDLTADTDAPAWHSERRSGDGQASPVASARAARVTADPAAPSAGPDPPAPVAGAGRKRAALRPGDLPGAGRAALPRDVAPQLATLVASPPAGEGWIHEVKFDGYRALCHLEAGAVRFVTRGGHDWTERFPGPATAVLGLYADSALLDGELVALRPDGHSSFERLQQALSTHSEGVAFRSSLAYVVFDLLYLDGYDLRATPLTARKDMLLRLLSASPASAQLRFSEHIEGRGEAFYHAACEQGLEGAVCKLAAGVHRDGRTRDWLKVKCLARQEFVVGGFTDPAGARVGLGALLLGVYEGSRLVYAGKVGTGFKERDLLELQRRLFSLQSRESPFGETVPRAEVRGAHWVTPSLVVEARFGGWTSDGRLRHASFQGIREDKRADEVSREDAAPAGDGRRGEGEAVRVDAVERGHAEVGGGPPPRPTSTHTAHGDAEVAGMRISHPDRVVFGESGITKLEVAEYYALVWQLMEPHVSGRPLTLVRCPDGSDGSCFYQKHIESGFSRHVRTVTIREGGGPAAYPVVDSLAGLLGLVQMGTLELHAWGSPVSSIEQPDTIVFDLDPGPDVAWRRVPAAARLLRDLLRDLGLASYVKTSGGKGLHVVVPLVPQASWDQVKAFSKALAESVAVADPESFTTNMSKAKRGGRIFIDYLRNGRGATSVVAYSLRARAGAPVSAPVLWDRLGPDLRPDSVTLRSAPARLRARRSDPWDGYQEARRPLPPAG